MMNRRRALGGDLLCEMRAWWEMCAGARKSFCLYSELGRSLAVHVVWEMS